MDERRLPVVIGAGQINDRSEDDAAGLNALELMRAALQRADAEAGGGWLSKLDALHVVAQLSFPELGDCSRPLADLIGAHPRLCAQTRYPMGDSPVSLLIEAAGRIARGDTEIEAVAGGEALRTAQKRAAKTGAARTDALRASAARAAKAGRARYGMIAPTDVYPLYENACRAAWGQSLAEAQAESAEIWSRFSHVAAQNQGAWLRSPLTPAQILERSPANRPIAFPYTKLMVANASVNQGAGFIVTSLARAKAAGVPEARLAYVGAGAAAREPGDVLTRGELYRSPSLEATLAHALGANALAGADLDHVELYSCFPCMPKMARRVIDWPLERPMSVFGGLTFGGGPVGNYMSHAIAAMADALRAGGTHGLLFGNGGFATTSAALILSRDPAIAANAARDADAQPAADAARAPAPVLLETYAGPARIETYTVFYDRDGAPRFAAIVARTPAHERFLARIEAADEAAIAFLTDGAAEPVGAEGFAHADAEGLVRWRF